MERDFAPPDDGVEASSTAEKTAEIDNGDV